MSVESVRATKESAAKTGIAAGALLAVIELAGGIFSGSLGLVSSALNTIMDLVASVIAFFAVKEGGKPPDKTHLYGHEKVEAFAAIGEISLLFIICAWLIYVAVGRLASGAAGVHFLWVAIGTNFASILIDAYVYQRFKSVSNRLGSEALGAGALHFLNDLFIAIVVIMGLAFYSFGLWYADSVAALGVIAITLYSSVDMVSRSASILMDTAPKGAVERLRSRILSVEGVEGCHSLRVRRAGPKHFVDAHVEVKDYLPLSQAHTIAEAIESEISKVFPGSDVIIHTEPHPSGDPVSRVREASSRFPEIKGVHGISVDDIGDRRLVSYHLEMDAKTSLEHAHNVAHQLEERLKLAFGGMTMIISHLEPTIKLSEADRLSIKEMVELRIRIIQIAEGSPEIRSVHNIRSLSIGGILCITLHCTTDGALSLDQAHEVATKLEQKIKAADPRIGHVIIHCEPQR